MMKFGVFAALLILAAATGIDGQETITGRIVNDMNAPLDSAKVWMKSDPSVFVYTGADGNFSLPVTGTIHVRRNTLNGLQPFNASHGDELFYVNGRKVSAPSGSLNENFPWGKYIDRHEPETRSFQPKIMAPAAADSLIVLRMGYEINKVEIEEPVTQEVDDITLSNRTYRLDTTVTVLPNRTMEVIVPSDFDELYTLPVLYLLHGSTDNHTSFRDRGNMIEALNTFEGRLNMQAMILVTPDVEPAEGNATYGRTADAFHADLTEDIRIFMETHYKADTSRYSRAVTGFSLGAMKTHNLALFYPEMWGYVFSLCGGLNLSDGFSLETLRSDIADGTIDLEAVNQLEMYRLYSNPSDIAYDDTRDLDGFYTEVGIEHTSDWTSYDGGGHRYPYTVGVIKEVAVDLFKKSP